MVLFLTKSTFATANIILSFIPLDSLELIWWFSHVDFVEFGRSSLKKNESIGFVQRGERGQTPNPNLHFGGIEKHSGYSLDQLISIFGSKL